MIVYSHSASYTSATLGLVKTDLKDEGKEGILSYLRPAYEFTLFFDGFAFPKNIPRSASDTHLKLRLG